MNSATTAPGNTAYGVQSGLTLSGTGNVAVGISSGQNITGSQNVTIGDQSGSNTLGNTNTGIGYQSSTNVTGSSNTATGAGAGRNVTGSANSALGSNAGQSVTGNANIAIGRNAGAGNGNSFSNTVAVGTSAVANQSSAVALGTRAVAGAPNSVALGAGSVADQANTVSVGTAGAERRITNVAPGMSSTNAATVGQLQNIQSQAQQGINVANKGVAMALAGAGATSASTTPGKTAISMGTGYFDGNTAIGIGMASGSNDGERMFRIGSAISPGLSDIALQANYQILVGPHTSSSATNVADAMFSPMHAPHTVWVQHGFTSVFKDPQSSMYHVKYNDRTFRIQLIDLDDAAENFWTITVDEKLRDGIWKNIDDVLDVKTASAPDKVLLAVIDSLEK